MIFVLDLQLSLASILLLHRNISHLLLSL